LTAASATGGAAGGAESAGAGPAAAGAGAGAGGAGDADAAGTGDVASLRDQVAALQNQLAESRRLLQLRDQQLQALQAQAAGATQPVADAASPPADAAAAPGIDLESQQVFADGADAASAEAATTDSSDSSPADGAAAASTPTDSAEAEADGAAAAAAENAASSAQPAASASEAAPAGARTAVTTPVAKPVPAPSLLSRVLGLIANPLLLIGLGIGAVLLTAVWYLRHRREEDDQDVTGRWDALEAEIEEEVQAQTVRTKRLPEEQSMIVEEQQTRRPRSAPAALQEEPAPVAARSSESIEDTLSSQTVINLDQADPVAEAEFHMAYGLYDQAADLVSKALEADPDRRDLKLKLLEVYFMWGNKDAFLSEACKLQAEVGDGGDRDWDKVLIMGKQICPDEPMFAESAAAAAGALDIDLEGDRSTELDFAFDEKDSGSTGSFDLGGADLDFELAATGERFAQEEGDENDAFSFGESDEDSGSDEDTGLVFAETDEDEGLFGEEPETSVRHERHERYESGERSDRGGRRDGDDRPFGVPLDIGAQTAAGLEAALFTGDDEDDDTRADSLGATAATADFDGLAVTQESPTVESQGTGDDHWAALLGEISSSEEEERTVDAAGPDSPTIETPTVETLGADAPTVETLRADAPTIETPTIETAYHADSPTVETPTIETSFAGRTTLVSPIEGSRIDVDVDGDAHADEGVSAEHTEEIDLDDLGLSLGDLEDLPEDIGELPSADDGESDTREQPVLRGDDELLSATGVTEVLHEDDLEQMETSVLQSDALLMAAVGADEDYRGTEIIEQRREADGSGDTSLVRSLSGYVEEGELDLNLEDLSAALEGGDTIEQRRGSSFHADFFGGGSTPIDLDIGSDLVGPDDPTGTEHMGPLDPQTMTEIGTKLDLARAYIDMGDPEGARSILEEVLDEGDVAQRREAQELIDALSV
jgi:FimV-like protein